MQLKRLVAIVFGLGLVVALVVLSTQFAATPSSDPDPVDLPRPGYLFIQTAWQATLSPTKRIGEYRLVLDEVGPHTIYFGDHPQVDFGAVAMESFLDEFLFSKINPPDAALVLNRVKENREIVIVELLSYRYDMAKRQLRYRVRLLADHQVERFKLGKPNINDRIETGSYYDVSVIIHGGLHDVDQGAILQPYGE